MSLQDVERLGFELGQHIAALKAERDHYREALEKIGAAATLAVYTTEEECDMSANWVERRCSIALARYGRQETKSLSELLDRHGLPPDPIEHDSDLNARKCPDCNREMLFKALGHVTTWRCGYCEATWTPVDSISSDSCETCLSAARINSVPGKGRVECAQHASKENSR